MALNFSDKVYLQIGGEIGKNNSLPLNYFAELAKNLQTLVDNLAALELPEDEGFDPKNFRLELTDFRAGSAVPAFSFTQNIQNVIGGDVDEQRAMISSKFEELMSIAATGEYGKLNELFPDSKKKTEITQSLYGFVNSLKTPKVAFGNFDKKGSFKQDFKIKKFKKSLRDELIEVKKEPVEVETEYVYGRIELTKSNGKERKTIKEMYRPETAKLAHVFTEIVATAQTYQLSAPFHCSLSKNEEDAILIESEMLNLSSAGKTVEEAIENFSEAFHGMFEQLNSTKYSDLTEKMRVVKTFFTVLVKA